MYFSQTPHPGPVPSAEALKVLDAYFAWRRTPEGEAWAKSNDRALISVPPGEETARPTHEGRAVAS